MQWVPTRPPNPRFAGPSSRAVNSTSGSSSSDPRRSWAPALKSCLRGQTLPIEIAHASEWISMDDKAAQAVRTKRNSSMRVGLRSVKEGHAEWILHCRQHRGRHGDGQDGPRDAIRECIGRRLRRFCRQSPDTLPSCSTWAQTSTPTLKISFSSRSWDTCTRRMCCM